MCGDKHLTVSQGGGWGCALVHSLSGNFFEDFVLGCPSVSVFPVA